MLFAVEDISLAAVANKVRQLIRSKDIIPFSEILTKLDEVYGAGATEGAYQFYNFFNNSYLRGNYFSYTFAGTHWSDEIFLPNKDLKPIYILHLFTTSAIVDIVGCLQRVGRVFDSSKAYYINYIAKDNQYSKNMPFIDTSSCGNLKCLLYNCSKLEVMEGIKFKNDGSQLFDQNYSFGKLPELNNIKRIEGVIGQDGVDFSGSPKLCRDVYYRIFNALSTTTQGKTVTFSRVGVDETFYDWLNNGGDSQEWFELTMTRPNWSVALK